MIRKRSLRALLFYIFATGVAVLILIPFFWMVSTSLKEKTAILIIPVQWIPDPVSTEGYTKVFTLFPFDKAVLNSAFVSVAITAVTILSSLMAAYAFSKIDFKGREVLFKFYLATMMVPGQVTIIPVFLVLKSMGLVNTFTGLILPSVFNAFAVFMFRQHLKTISNDYMDSAVIDGASHITIFAKIILPLSSPIIATLVVLTFMGAWNDFFWPLVILNDKDKMTLPLALNQLNGQYSSQYNTLMAGSLISMLPIILVYILAQKYFRTGLQLGGIKG